MHINNVTVFVTGLWCITLLLAGCAGDEQPHALERARTAGLRVGFAIEPPYSFIDSATDEPTGEAPIILRRVTDDLGISDVRWYPFAFHDLTHALLRGRIDVIAAGMFASAERSRDMRFSTPTACVRPLLVSRSPAVDSLGERIRTPRQDCEGCRIAVIQGSVEQRALQRQETRSDSLIIVPDLSTAVAAVMEGAADALAISAPTARDIARRHATLVLDERRLPEKVGREAAGCPAFAFRHQDADLAAAFDSVLRAYIGSPAHLEAVRAFGFTAAELSCDSRLAASTETVPVTCTNPE